MPARLVACWALACVLALSACGGSDASGSAKAAPEALTAVQFESGAFLRRHPPRERRVDSSAAPRTAWIYTLRDPETTGTVVLVLQGSEARIEAITVHWPAGEQPASWNSIKNQFVADLLESSFTEVEDRKSTRLNSSH